MQTTTRNATLDDLVALLTEQHARRLDVVAPASTITARDGQLVIRGTEAVLSDDGVTTADGTYTPTAVCDEGLADKLGVPVAYLKRLRAERPDLYDANLNGWLHGRKALYPAGAMLLPEEERHVIREAVPADKRAAEPVGTSDEAVQEVTKPLGYTQEHMAGILDHFRRGAQFTRAGVVNAITAYSQTVDDADAAHDLDAAATRLLLV